MRLLEFFEAITEVKVIRMPKIKHIPKLEGTKVWKNPTKSELKILVKKHTILRGLATTNELFVWDMYGPMIHDHAMILLNAENAERILISEEGGSSSEDSEYSYRNDGLFLLWMPKYARNPEDIWASKPLKAIFHRGINEAKIVKIPSHRIIDGYIRVWLNPTVSELKQITQKIPELRGFMSKKNILVWNSRHSWHDDMWRHLEEYLDDYSSSYKFVITKDKKSLEADEWKAGGPYNVNGMMLWIYDRHYDYAKEHYPTMKRLLSSNINEAQHDDEYAGYLLYMNPNAYKTRYAIKRSVYGSVRIGVDKDNNYWIWDGASLNHKDLEDRLNLKHDSGFYIEEEQDGLHLKADWLNDIHDETVRLTIDIYKSLMSNRRFVSVMRQLKISDDIINFSEKMKRLLSEAKVIKGQSVSNRGLRLNAYMNPTHSEMKAFINRFGEMRGIVTYEKLMVWDAGLDLLHGMAEDEFGFSSSYPMFAIYIYQEGTDIQYASEWYSEGQYQIDANGISVLATDKTAKDTIVWYPSMMRALGLGYRSN